MSSSPVNSLSNLVPWIPNGPSSFNSLHANRSRSTSPKCSQPKGETRKGTSNRLRPRATGDAREGPVTQARARVASPDATDASGAVREYDVSFSEGLQGRRRGRFSPVTDADAASLAQQRRRRGSREEGKFTSAQRALKQTTGHRKYGLVTMRSSAGQFNKAAMKTFSARLSNCFDKFQAYSDRSREEIYREVEEQTSKAIRAMEQEAKDIQGEVEGRFKKEEEVARDDMLSRALASVNAQYADAESSLLSALRAEGPDVTSRQRAHEATMSKLKSKEAELRETHRRNLEDGAKAMLQEREAALCGRREEVTAKMEEEQRRALSNLSDSLSTSAKEQISAYRIELENLRDARVTSARSKESEKTEKIVQELKRKFIAQAESEVGIASRDALSDEDAAISQVRDEISRFQSLKATEITTSARAHRAETLPSMAIELEERAENIERNFRIGLMEGDTREEREVVRGMEEELKGERYEAIYLLIYHYFFVRFRGNLRLLKQKSKKKKPAQFTLTPPSPPPLFFQATLKAAGRQSLATTISSLRKFPKRSTKLEPGF